MSLLERTYLIEGLDRLLYSEPPSWPNGSFYQEKTEHFGQLVLRDEGISSAAELVTARSVMDRQAERFRLAISRRTGCPLKVRLTRCEEPNFDEPGSSCLTSRTITRDGADAVMSARAPPPEMEQLPEAAARWIQTIAEARSFDQHPDEVFKRFYLIIEELKPLYRQILDDDQIALTDELRWIRNFVSHHECDNTKVCSFIRSRLPDAVIHDAPTPTVRFDRTKVGHRNFIGRYEVIARTISNLLIDEAIAAMDP